MGQWKSRVNVNVNSRLRIRRALNSTSGWTRVGGVALCKLLTTYLVCRAFYNPGDPLHIYIHARACTCRSQIRPVVSLVQEGGNFMIAAHPITSLAFSSASLSISLFLSRLLNIPFSICFSLAHRLVKLHTLCCFYVSSGFSVPVRCHYTPHKAEHYRPAIFSPETRYHWPRKSIPFKASVSRKIPRNIILQYFTRAKRFISDDDRIIDDRRRK